MLHIIALEHQMTDEELRRSLCEAMHRIISGGMDPAFVAIKGFDNDSRELYEIPEAVAFMRRLMAVGYGACMDMHFEQPPAGLSFPHLFAFTSGLVKKGTGKTEVATKGLAAEYLRQCQAGNALYDAWKKDQQATNNPN